MLMHPTFGTGQVELLEREINRNGAFNLVLLFDGLSPFQRLDPTTGNDIVVFSFFPCIFFVFFLFFKTAK